MPKPFGMTISYERQSNGINFVMQGRTSDAETSGVILALWATMAEESRRDCIAMLHHYQDGIDAADPDVYFSKLALGACEQQHGKGHRLCPQKSSGK